jgi:hypothetical protein
MLNRFETALSVSLSLLSTGSLALADSLPRAPRGESIPYSLISGAQPNEAANVQTVFSHLVQFHDAAWTRIHFSRLELEAASVIRITSQLDGEVQELNAYDAHVWNNSTAYFNGDSVVVELLAAPGTLANTFEIDHVDVEFNGQAPQEPEGASGQCGICGTDDRVPSNENWSARLMPVGCTASVYSSCNCLVSAGHCVTSGMVVQFNVPNSQTNCGLVNPPVADQFPIVSFQHSYVDIGNDWSVLKAGTNNLGQTPYQRYGQFRPIATGVSPVGAVVGIWGYGMDTNCVNNQRQQYSTGLVNVVAPTTIQFSADLRAGNSGTGVIRNGAIIGVATNCMVGCPNVATAINVPAFANARNSLCPCSATQCPGDVNGDSLVATADLLTVINSWGSCPSPPTTCAADIVAVPPLSTVDTNDLLVVLNNWGGCP